MGRDFMRRGWVYWLVALIVAWAIGWLVLFLLVAVPTIVVIEILRYLKRRRALKTTPHA